MDWKHENDHQRDWDRKASGLFELSVMKEIGEKRNDTPSTFQEKYMDEKASIVSGSEEEFPRNQYPSTPRLIALCCGLAMIVFTVALDNTVRCASD